MTVFLALLLCIVFLDLKTAGKDRFYSDFMSRERTSAVNGLFTLLVFFSHAGSYLPMDAPVDAPYTAFRGFLGQLVVVPFLFYSGYGILESIRQKGLPYVKAIPFRRFFRVFYHMAVAVCLYIIVNLILGNEMTVSNTLLAFTGWTSIGNSNWYVFAILSLYAIAFVSFLAARGNLYLGAAFTTALTLLCVFWQMRLGRDSWTYDTMLMFPAGMVFSLARPYFQKLLGKNDAIYMLFFAGLLAVFLLANERRGSNLGWYTLWCGFFMLLVLALTMKFSLNNSILQWLGSHVFSIYILQRIPFQLLCRLGYRERPYLCIVLSFCFTAVLAVLFDAAVSRLDRLLYSRREEKGEKLPEKGPNP